MFPIFRAADYKERDAQIKVSPFGLGKIKNKTLTQICAEERRG
jgi:hypothetical protein